MNCKEFIEYIKHKRERSFITQKDLAKKIPINKCTYCKIENHKQEPSFFMIKRLAEIFDIDLNIIKSKTDEIEHYFD